MKALWKHDWYRIGLKMTALLAFLLLLTILFYRHAFVTEIPHYIFKNMPQNRILWYCYNDTSPVFVIWAFPLATAWVSGKMVSDDRRFSWEKLCRAMPLTTWRYVTEKYLFGCAFMLGSTALVMLCQTVYVLTVGVFDGWFMTLFFLRYMMVLLSVSAILTVLTYWKSFFFAVLFAVMLFLLLPALLSTLFDNQWFVFGIGTPLYRIMTKIFDWLFHQPKGIICGSMAAVVLYGLSYILCLRIACTYSN